MKILYIDTSSNYLYSAIAEDKTILAEVKEEFGQSLSEEALPKIVTLFEQANLNPKDIQKIIVVDGPGSFTGIRIGITIAKVYAWSLNIPITTIKSLEAMAISSDSKKIHIPMINARRGYVYAAIYGAENEVILKPQHIELKELQKEIEKLSQEYEFISNDEFDTEFIKEAYSPNFSKIIMHYKDRENINPHAVNPKYLKLTEAEESRL